MKRFEKGTKVIVDTGYGYELGLYEGLWVKGNSHVVLVITGKVPGHSVVDDGEIQTYNEKIRDILVEKYGYVRDFSDINVDILLNEAEGKLDK